MKENMFINNETKIALLIDAENTNVKYIDAIFSEIKKYGNVTYQRMYGDFAIMPLLNGLKNQQSMQLFLFTSKIIHREKMQRI